MDGRLYILTWGDHDSQDGCTKTQSQSPSHDAKMFDLVSVKDWLIASRASACSNRSTMVDFRDIIFLRREDGWDTLRHGSRENESELLYSVLSAMIMKSVPTNFSYTRSSWSWVDTCLKTELDSYLRSSHPTFESDKGEGSSPKRSVTWKTTACQVTGTYAHKHWDGDFPLVFLIVIEFPSILDRIQTAKRSELKNWCDLHSHPGHTVLAVSGSTHTPSIHSKNWLSEESHKIPSFLLHLLFPIHFPTTTTTTPTTHNSNPPPHLPKSSTILSSSASTSHQHQHQSNHTTSNHTKCLKHSQAHQPSPWAATLPKDLLPTNRFLLSLLGSRRAALHFTLHRDPSSVLLLG